MPRGDDLEQALRRSHCTNTEQEHKCVGVVTIDSDGCRLECKRCGSGAVDWRPSEAQALRARRVLRAAGMDYDSLSLDAQRAVVEQMDRA